MWCFLRFFKICTSHKKDKDLVDFLWNDLVSIEVDDEYFDYDECWLIKRFDLKCLLLCWTRQLNKWLYCTQYFSSIFKCLYKIEILWYFESLILVRDSILLQNGPLTAVYHCGIQKVIFSRWLNNNCNKMPLIG